MESNSDSNLNPAAVIKISIKDKQLSEDKTVGIRNNLESNSSGLNHDKVNSEASVWNHVQLILNQDGKLLDSTREETVQFLMEALQRSDVQEKYASDIAACLLKMAHMGKKTLAVLKSNGYLNILLVWLKKSSLGEDVEKILVCLILLSKHDGKGFNTQFRLLGGLESIMSVYNQTAMDSPIYLKALEILATSSKSNIMAKQIASQHAVVSRLLQSLDDRHSTLFAAKVLANITKHDGAINVLANSENMHTITRLLSAKVGHAALTSYLLEIIKNIVKTNEGFKIFQQCDGAYCLSSLIPEIAQHSYENQQKLYQKIVCIFYESNADKKTLPYLSDVDTIRRPIFDMNHVSEPTPANDEILSRFLPEKNTYTTEPVIAGAKSIKSFVFDVNPTLDRALALTAKSDGLEPLLDRSSDLSRRIVETCIERLGQIGDGVVVYDVYHANGASVANDHLIFESRFESGNLWKAVKISDLEYDLVLESDINTELGRHNQWFFFQIKNMKRDKNYIFNIVNMTKTDGSFNHGMTPVFLSEKQMTSDSIGWTRRGTEIALYRNHFVRSCEDKKELYYGTLRLQISFPYDGDTCFIAYHFPYTYTQLQNFLQIKLQNPAASKIVSHQYLTQTLSQNNLNILTITNFETVHEGGKRPYVLLSARIHPGESNSSLMMHGILEYLLGETPSAKLLRDTFIFKCIPMLNPDGVINGSHRCSLAGCDLNRQWANPDARQFPTIYWTKSIWNYVKSKTDNVLLLCDFHGHSRRFNAFFFGCDSLDRQEVDASSRHVSILSNNSEKIFPALLSEFCPENEANFNIFDFDSCKFTVDSSKESTARVVMAREIGIPNSFTCESTYCGGSKNLLKNAQVSIRHLLALGRYFVDVIPAFQKTLGKLERKEGEEALKVLAEIIERFNTKSTEKRGRGDVTLSRHSSLEQVDVDDISEEEAEWFLY